MITLYGNPISPFARKVMILARLHGIDLNVVSPPSDVARGYTDGLNPLGKVPALTLGDGTVLYDSPVICQYLDAVADAPLLPSDPIARARELTLHALGDGIATATYNYRYEFVRGEALHWPQMITRHETAIAMATTHLETEIETLGRDWRFGTIAIVCALDYAAFRAGHVDWQANAPKLAHWHEGMKSAPYWDETYGYE